ncbi:MAG: hypothetical protein AB7K24_25235 [Gemmataceae bacterium]
MRYRHWLWTLAWLPLVGSVPAAEPQAQRPEAIFRSLQAADAKQAQERALNWLRQAGKADEATLAKFNALWAEDVSVLDRVARTFALGDAEAARLLREAGDPHTPAPTELPALLTDANQPSFYRANLGLAYARALTQRRVHEEALQLFASIKPDQVVDPSAYFFYRAVAEHALALKDQAQQTIRTMREDVVDAPDRYQRVAQLMLHDMDSWNAPVASREDMIRQKLGHVARNMSNVERRLDLARGGEQTQAIQRRVVAQLDELIKSLEPPDGPSDPRDPDDPSDPKDPGPPGPPKPGPGPGPGPGEPPIVCGPMPTSKIAGGSGPGQVNDVKLRQLLEQWGKLPERDRAQAMAMLKRSMPAYWTAIMEKHSRDMARIGGR